MLPFRQFPVSSGALIGFAGLLIATACVVHGPRGRVAVVAPVPVVTFTYVDREPPPSRFEDVPPRPSEDHFWISGYWSWGSGIYSWVPGRYHLRPRPGVRWVDGRWNRHHRHGWYWQEGHWR